MKKGAKNAKTEAFAVIKTGGKQYEVSTGTVLKIEKLKDLKVGDKVSFDEVLLSQDGDNLQIGTPNISGLKVEATVKRLGQAAKVDVVKYKAKSRYYKKRGHRQPFTEVEILAIK